jgi:hypothetical protein
MVLRNSECYRIATTEIILYNQNKDGRKPTIRKRGGTLDSANRGLKVLSGEVCGRHSINLMFKKGGIYDTQ